jgi:hypothetical protein
MWTTQHTTPLLTCYRPLRASWAEFWALALSMAYGLLLFLASLCAVTTLVPTDDHAHASHQHTTPAAQHSPRQPDACTCVLQGLMPTVSPAMPLLSCVLPASMVLSLPASDAPGLMLCIQSWIRAPPHMHS